jgi:hypothetical protein
VAKNPPSHPREGWGEPNWQRNFPNHAVFCGKQDFVDYMRKPKPVSTFYFCGMRWLSAQQVREIFREVLGWDVHPKTLRVWARTGKLRSIVSPGRGRTFYPIEEVAEVLGLEPSQVAAIVQKEKGGRP